MELPGRVKWSMAQTNLLFPRVASRDYVKTCITLLA